ncbi:MAG TPA: S1 family peptidase [Polyangiaceae bacterium]|jgi:hypothetical protein
MLALSGCARLFGFRSEPAQAPVPAASPKGDEEREPIELMPPAIATDDDYVVRIVAGEVTCSGTLIDDDQVLTAHHCVARRGAHGQSLPENVSPSTIHVELGGDDLPWGEVAVRAVIAPSCGYVSGDGDLAVLVLERHLVGIPTKPIRLDDPPAIGEAVVPIGFGRCALSNGGIHRRLRAGGPIETLADGRFLLKASICPGDSGGPALSSRSGEVLGVVSASVMDGDETTRDRSEFVRVDHFRPLFANAKLVSKGMHAAELPPVDCR